MKKIYIKAQNCAMALDVESGLWSFGTDEGSIPGLSGKGLLPLLPVINGSSIIGGIIDDLGVQPDGARLIRATAQIRGAANGEVVNDIYVLSDRAVCVSSYVVDSLHSLEHWSLSGEGGIIEAESLHAYVGTHGGRDVNGSLMYVNGNITVSTATHNWTYANAMPRLMLYGDGTSIVLGGTDVANDFGLELKSESGFIKYLRFNYGGMESPWCLPGGYRQKGPRLQLIVAQTACNDEAHGHFTQAMIDDGIVECKRYRPEESGWRKPWYCTWGDQNAIAEATLKQDQFGSEKFSAINAALTQDMVMKAARLIYDNRLNIGTIIIDSGWQDKYGDWNLITSKFPDMRGLVDELHRMGFKVVIWFAPFLTEPGAEILNRPGFTYNSTLKHNQTLVNYANTAVRDWIESKLSMWFSSNADGWDIDGLKLDFMLEKIYPGAHSSDPEWRGEERCFMKLFEMFNSIIRRYKTSSGILHTPYNPHFTRYCTALHTEERFDEYLEYLESRSVLVESLIPGVWTAPHFNYNIKIVPDFIRRVKKVGGIVQIGKLLCEDVKPSFIHEIRTLLADSPKTQTVFRKTHEKQILKVKRNEPCIMAYANTTK
jgi:hypothetical protein